jgi:hypothetical protein
LAWLPEFGCTLAKAHAEQLAGTLDGEVLGNVHVLAAAVIAPARIALGVLVGHHRALRLHHGAETMFSEAISSISSRWRPSSLRIAPKSSGREFRGSR